MPHDLFPATPLADLAVTLREEANAYASSNGGLEVLAARMSIAGLNEEVAARILADARRRADHLADGHLWFKLMCEDEAYIRRALNARLEPRRSAWPRIKLIVGGGR